MTGLVKAKMDSSSTGKKRNILIDAFNSADGETRKEFFLWLNDNRYSLIELIEVLRELSHSRRKKIL
jgi:hypothetical protein